MSVYDFESEIKKVLKEFCSNAVDLDNKPTTGDDLDTLMWEHPDVLGRALYERMGEYMSSDEWFELVEKHIKELE